MSRRVRQEAKRETRRALIRAGAELFGERGLDGPSLDAICERAGYTRGAFYVHFRDRDDFLVAVMEDLGRPVLDALLVVEDGDDLAAVAMRFLRAFADGSYPLAPAGGFGPHQLIDACMRSERVRELYVRLVEEAIGRVGKTIAASQASGAVRRDVDAGELARLLLALVIGAQTMLELSVSVDLGRAAHLLFTLLRPPDGQE